MRYPHTNFKHDFIYSKNKRRSGSAYLLKLSKSIMKNGRGASPNFNEEKKLWRKGYKYVAGLDEAGRGPLAGPVVAGAVVLRNFKFQNLNLKIISKSKFQNIKDSKQLTSKQREELYKILTNHPKIEWGIGRVSEKVIDKINILEATKMAMEKAVLNLEKKMNLQKKLKISSAQKWCDLTFSAEVDFLILDGNFKINSKLPQKSIIKGDEKVFSCAAASIIAKVTRDRIMLKYDKKYPKYGFKKHKGYPTKFHRKMLKKIGPCLIHRKTFSWT